MTTEQARAQLEDLRNRIAKVSQTVRGTFGEQHIDALDTVLARLQQLEEEQKTVTPLGERVELKQHWTAEGDYIRFADGCRVCVNDAGIARMVVAEHNELIVAVLAQGQAPQEPHDCEAWGMEGLGCAHCNPAAQESRDTRHSLIKRAEAAEARLQQGEEEQISDAVERIARSEAAIFADAEPMSFGDGCRSAYLNIVAQITRRRKAADAPLQPRAGEPQEHDQGAGLAAVDTDTTEVPTPELSHVDSRVEYKCKQCGTSWGPLSAPAKCPTCGQFSHGPSHLDHESPKFEGKPHIWIQWKGTDVCCDIHCACGAHCHFDGDFLYFFQCPHCERYWEVGTHMAIYEVPKERAERCCQSVDRDDDWEPQIGSGTPSLSEASPDTAQER